MAYPDLRIQDEGNIFILIPITPAGHNWIWAHIPDDAQKWGNGIVVEHRYITMIEAAAIGDGLEVEE